MMKKNNFLVALVALFASLSSFSPKSSEAATPMGAPFSIWSKTSYDDNGKLLNMTHIEQGIDWFEPVKGVRFNTFVGSDIYASNRPNNYWERDLSPEIGVKFVHHFTPIKGGYATVELGGMYKRHQYYRGGAENTSGLEAFLGLNLGGDWLNGRSY